MTTTETTTTEISFDAALARFLGECQEMINAYYERSLKNLTPPSLTIEPGSRYIRVVKNDSHGTSRSVYCFVDKNTGDILKAASWKAPAKGVRGNVTDHASKSCGTSGAHYRR